MGVAPGGPALAPALPLRDGEGHALQPLLVGLRGADLGHDRAQQFVHQLQHLVRILSVVPRSGRKRTVKRRKD